MLLTEKKASTAIYSRDHWDNAVTMNGLVICMIAKNGTVSLRDALLRAKGIERENIIDFSDLDCSQPDDTTGFRIGFIRDPVARALSCFKNKILLQGICEKEPRLLRHGYRSGCRLDEFVGLLKHFYHLDKHTDHQYRYLAKSMDTLCAFDVINEHWKLVQKQFTWLPALRWLNQTRQMNDIPYRLEKQIRQIYAEDDDLYRSLVSGPDGYRSNVK